MTKAVLGFLVLFAGVSAQAEGLKIDGTYVQSGACQCLQYAEKAPCPVAPPALSVFANSILQGNPYVNPSETGATIPGSGGSQRTVKAWVYRTSIGGPELKVREGDQVEISLRLAGNKILVTAKNVTLPQEALSFPLIVPRDQDGGGVDQPAKTETLIDESGLLHKQASAERYVNHGTGEKGVTYSSYMFMMLSSAGGGLDIGTVYEHKNKPDWSFGQPKTFNFGSVRCSLIKK